MDTRQRLELMAEIVHNGQHHQWNDWRKCNQPVCVENRAALAAPETATTGACTCNDSSNEDGCPIHGAFYMNMNPAPPATGAIGGLVAKEREAMRWAGMDAATGAQEYAANFKRRFPNGMDVTQFNAAVCAIANEIEKVSNKDLEVYRKMEPAAIQGSAPAKYDHSKCGLRCGVWGCECPCHESQNEASAPAGATWERQTPSVNEEREQNGTPIAESEGAKK